MDINSINMPDFSIDLNDADVYCYAGYMKPGYH